MPWTEIDGSPIHYTPTEGSTATEAEVQADIKRALHEAASSKIARLQHMPTEADAIRVLTQAAHRLEELGWRNPIYCPKDGTEFDVIEVGSSGIHRCHYMGEWPTGSWWIAEAGDLWPSRPSFFRPLPPAEHGASVAAAERSGEACAGKDTREADLPSKPPAESESQGWRCDGCHRRLDYCRCALPNPPETGT